VATDSDHAKKESRIFAEMRGLGDKDEGIPAENNRCHSVIDPGQLLLSLSLGERRSYTTKA